MMSSGRALSTLDSNRQISANTHSEPQINPYPYTYNEKHSNPTLMAHKSLRSMNVVGGSILENYKIFHLEPSRHDLLRDFELQVINLVELSSLEAEAGKKETALEYAYKSQEILDRLKVKFTAQERSSSSLSSKSGSGSISGEQINSPAQSKSRDLSPDLAQPVTKGVNMSELSIMVSSNLATQLKNNGRLEDALEIYFQLCKSASSVASGIATAASRSMFMTPMGQTSSTGKNGAQQQSMQRFGLNIGNVFFMMEEYQQALKYYRLTLDRLSSTSHRNLRIKLMNNIAITLIKINNAKGSAALGTTIDLASNGRKNKLSQQITMSGAGGDPVTSLNMLLTDNLSQQTMFGVDQQPSRQSGVSLSRRTACNANHHQFGLNLIASLYCRSDLNLMLASLRSLVSVDICHHYDCVLQVDKTVVEASDLTNTLAAEIGSANEVESNGRRQRWLSSKSASHSDDTSQMKQQNHGRYSAARQSKGVDGSESLSSYADSSTQVTGALPVESGTEVFGLVTEGRRANELARLVSGKDEAIDEHQRLPQGEPMETGFGRTNIQQHQLIGQADKVADERAHDVKQIVMKHISADELERLISKRRANISRALLVSCNLILDLSRELTVASDTPTRPSSTAQPQAGIEGTTSMLDTCCNLFAQSDSYKSLSLDLRMNRIIAEMANCETSLRAAIESLQRLESQASPLVLAATTPSSRSALLNSTDRPRSVGVIPSMAATINSATSHKSTVHLNGLSPMALNDFSWLVYLAEDYTRSRKYAELSLLLDMRNVSALVNLANCTMATNNTARGAEKYIELALRMNENHQVAIYNSLILARKLGYHFDDLRPSVKKLLRGYYSPIVVGQIKSAQHEICAMSPLKIENALMHMQTSLILQQSDMVSLAAATLNRLINGTPNGAKVTPPELHLIASRLIQANSCASNESAASQSADNERAQVTALGQVYRRHQYCLPLAERLIALYIDGYDYKSAQCLLKHCIRNRPSQPKWYQMLAECHRRAADYLKAIEIYKQAVELFPSNTTFPRTLIRLFEELGMNEEKEALQRRYQLS